MVVEGGVWPLVRGVIGAGEEMAQAYGATGLSCEFVRRILQFDRSSLGSIFLAAVERWRERFKGMARSIERIVVRARSLGGAAREKRRRADRSYHRW